MTREHAKPPREVRMHQCRAEVIPLEYSGVNRIDHLRLLPCRRAARRGIRYSHRMRRATARASTPPARATPLIAALAVLACVHGGGQHTAVPWDAVLDQPQSWYAT